MTKAQRIAYKIGNQKRKLAIQYLAKHGPAQSRSYWASAGVPQNGKHTPAK